MVVKGVKNRVVYEGSCIGTGNNEILGDAPLRLPPEEHYIGERGKLCTLPRSHIESDNEERGPLQTMTQPPRSSEVNDVRSPELVDPQSPKW